MPEAFAIGTSLAMPSLEAKPRPTNSFLILRIGMGLANPLADGHYVSLYSHYSHSRNPQRQIPN
jgi:hypothetical protein